MAKNSVRRDKRVATPKIVRVTVEGGVVQHVGCPKGIKVIVKDYDTDGSEDDLKRHKNGDNYVESIWE